MRFGYWMPVFGGWLRNIHDEGMEASWDYVKRLTQRSEETGWDLTLIAELNLNDIKGVDQPALDAWSTAAALAAVTSIDRADGRGPAQFPPAGAVRQASREHRQHLGRPAGAQRRLLLVGGRSHAVRPPVRPARRPLCPHDRVAAGGRRPVDAGPLQLRRRALQAQGRDRRAQAGDASRARRSTRAARAKRRRR